MKNNQLRFILLFVFTISFSLSMHAQDLYEIRLYEMKTDEQIKIADDYLENALLPALHRQGVLNIGVFKPISNDTAVIKKIYVVTPFKSTDMWLKAKTSIEASPLYNESSKQFTNPDTSHLPYTRMQVTMLTAFPEQTKLIPTKLKANPDAVYELRSYESPTEKLHQIKVEMFNAGGEIKLFKSLDFQALFYGDVISGSRMPNLMYMIAFSSIAEREAHWKSFVSSDIWKKLSSDPHYQNNISVSHIDSIIMRRTPYSDL